MVEHISHSLKAEHRPDYRVLIIEDNEEDFLHAKEMLDQVSGRKFEVHWASSFEEGQREIIANHYHAVLVDSDLNGRPGMEIIHEASGRGYAAPLILLSGSGGPEADLEAMQAGATLNIAKETATPNFLSRAVQFAIQIKQKEQALLAREALLQEREAEMEKNSRALRLSEEKFAKSFRASPVAIAISTLAEGRFIEVNDSYTELFGFSRNELIGHTSIELGFFQDPEERQEIARRFRENSGFRNYELQLYTKSGMPREVLFSTERIEIDGQECMLSLVIDITERKKVEQSLRASEEELRQSEGRLREFMDSTHDSFFILDHDWRFRYINQRATEILGTSAEELIGKVYWEVFPRYTGTQVEAHYRKVMDERIPVNYQHGGVYSPYWYEVSIYPSRDGIAVFAADRTEEKKAQEALRQLSQAVEQSPACVVITDLKGSIQYVNPRFTKLTGYTQEEAIGQNPRILQSGRTPASVYRDMWKTILAGQQWQGEFCNRKKNGDMYWEAVSISPIITDTGEITHFVAVKEDITERKKTEEALREAHVFAAWMARFPEENPNPVARVSMEGLVLYCNPPAKELPGWMCEVGKQLPDPLLSLLKQSMTDAEELQADIQLADRFYSISVMPFQEEQYANLYGRDITSRRQMEEALAESAIQLERSNRELEQFAFVASHDLQEPLRKIRLFGDGLFRQLGAESSDQTRDYLDRMQKAAERMQRMIDGLLQLSRVSTQGGTFTQVDLKSVADEALSDLEARLRSTKGQVYITDLMRIEADELQMRQLFQNLIANALKFHRPDVPPVIYISGTIEQVKNLPMAKIQVKDNGIGFEQQYAGRIFQPFQRLHGKTEYEGTGLGLAICQKIVERHSGKIEVQSAPGEGTIFTVLLPVKAG